MNRPLVNITPRERVGRVLIGSIGAILLLIASGGPVTTVLAILLALAGLDGVKHVDTDHRYACVWFGLPR